jgi:hypothetical protein
MLSHIVYTFHIMIVKKFSAGIVYRKTYPWTTLSTKLLSHYFETEWHQKVHQATSWVTGRLLTAVA